MVISSEEFKGLEKYRQALNRVESLAEVFYEHSSELLAYANTLEKEEESHAMQKQNTTPQRPLSRKEQKILTLKAKNRNRYRLLLLNSSVGISMRLNTQLHDHTGTEEGRYCVLIGNNTKTAFRWHRNRNMCKQCHLKLWVKTLLLGCMCDAVAW